MLIVPEKQDFHRCMVKTFFFVTKFKAVPNIELHLALRYVCSLFCAPQVILKVKNYNHAHEWSKSCWIPYKLLLGSLIWGPMMLRGCGRKGIYLRCKRTVHSSNRRMSSFGCLAWKCVNSWISVWWQTRLLTCCLFFPQGPQYEQHQSAAPEASPQSALPGGAVSITRVVVRPVSAGHVLTFVSHIYSGNQIKQSKKAVSTNGFGPWGNT